MKKVLLVTIMIFSVMILSGCFKKAAKEQGKEEGVQVQEQEQKQEMKSEMERAMEMIRSGNRVMCQYRVMSEGQENVMTTYVEGKRYRMQMQFGEGEMNSVFDGENMHTWMKGQSQGTKMSMQCQKELGGEQAIDETQEEAEMSEDVEDVFFGAFNIKCENVNNIDFSVPKNVQFVDQCEMLRQQREMIKKMQSNPGNMPN
ncbi:MAG: hypothetical protein OEV93_05030 [Candidatus Moranbacteria bacterium]|nr:hypothetical protein [Candidatus Moranbacteria bacterium]